MLKMAKGTIHDCAHVLCNIGITSLHFQGRSGVGSTCERSPVNSGLRPRQISTCYLEAVDFFLL